MSEIVNVKISTLDPNPLRQLAKYPFNETKLETLRRSIKDVGLWEGVIARRAGNRLQIAFGHHRIEAARQELGKEAKAPIIIRDLTDEQMLQFMGRENLEDYNADFLVMLETWEAAQEYLSSRDHEKNPQDIGIARLLGWTRSTKRNESVVNLVAEACSSASRLIAGGYLTRSQLNELSIFSVREVCGRVVAQHEMLEKMAKQTQRPKQEIEQAKKRSGKAGARVARGVREGQVAPRDIRGQVDLEAYQHAREAKQQTPLFAMFGKSLADSIAKVAKLDTLAEKLEEIKRALGNIELDDDVQVVKRVALECEGASERFDKWHRTFANPKTKVVKLKEIGS